MNYTRIAEQRKLLGLSQEELAAKLNISQKSISKYERGDRRPSYEVLTAMSTLFGVSVDYLLGISPQPHVAHTKKGFFFFFFDDSLKNTFRTRLQESLRLNDMSTDELCNAVSFDSETCQKYLNGEAEPSLEHLLELSHLLEVSTDYLLDNSLQTTPSEIKMLNAFKKLDEDNQDIIIGRIKELLKEQASSPNPSALDDTKK